MLKRVEREYLTLEGLATQELAKANLGSERRASLIELVSAAELTYLLRLFSAFEAGLTRIGPVLSSPRTFAGDASLGDKLNQIGSAMNMSTGFRATVDQDLRELRNELMHGRSLVPRLSFASVYELMRAFRRGCH